MSDEDFRAAWNTMKDWVDYSPDGMCAICGDKINGDGPYQAFIGPMGPFALHPHCKRTADNLEKIDDYLRAHYERRTV